MTTHSFPSIVRIVRDETPGPEHLAATPRCDADHPAIVRIATDLTRDAAGPREAAVALFTWVRDEITYTMGDWNWRASDTLALRLGTCSNKANLLVALCRAVGIPAAFGVQDVKAESYFGAGCLPMLRPWLKEAVVHLHSVVWLDGRWIRCDATDDRELTEGCHHLVRACVVLPFDGVHDALLPFAPGAVLREQGPLASIDDRLDRAPRCVPVVRMIGLYVAFMRVHGPRYAFDSDAERARIEADFRGWMAVRHPADWTAYLAVERTLALAAAI